MLVIKRSFVCSIQLFSYPATHVLVSLAIACANTPTDRPSVEFYMHDKFDNHVISVFIWDHRVALKKYV